MAGIVPSVPELPQERQPELIQNVDAIEPLNSDAKTQRNTESCCICLAQVTSATRAVATPCLHACFDFSCLVTWLEGAQRTCPVCKQMVETVKYNFDSKGKGFQKYQIKSSNSEGPSKSTSNRHNLQRRAETRRVASTSLDLPADDIPRRRFVYKNRLRSLHIGSNPSSRFKTYTPSSIRSSPQLISKAKAFIRRELEVFDWTEKNREWLVEYILGVIKVHKLKGADGKAEDLVEEVLGREFASVFVHELDAFLRSPFKGVREWDRWAKYQVEIPKDLRGVELDEG